jgi:hypothetical protein
LLVKSPVDLGVGGTGFTVRPSSRPRSGPLIADTGLDLPASVATAVAVAAAGLAAARRRANDSDDPEVA